MSTGTRNSHVSRDTMLRCAIRSRDAFLDLSSLVSFVIALNMDDDGSYEAAFYKLRTRHRDPVHSGMVRSTEALSCVQFFRQLPRRQCCQPLTLANGLALFIASL